MRSTTLVSAAAIVLASALPATADTNSDVAKCAAIEGTVDRLQCFDDLASALKLDKPQPVAVPAATGGTGKWQVSRTKNPVDDTETVTITLEADEGKARFGGSYLFVGRCKSDKTEAYIVWDDYLGNDGDIYNDYKVVTVRIGSQPADKQRWSTSTDSKATFAPSWAGNLLKQMAKETSFLAQVTPFNESPATAIFDTTGMTAALAPLAEVCKWEID